MKCITEMYEHQIKAVEKLKRLTVGGLFMEMGTGKTRTALELISIRLNKGKVDKVVWLCPCSVKVNLEKDIIKHLGFLDNRIEIHGIQTLSSSIKVNSYLLDLFERERVFLIVDESSLVKNHLALRTKNIIRLSKMCKYKLILNGTPISRNEEDLYSQMYILDWRILGYRNFNSFANNHLEQIVINGKRHTINALNTGYLAAKIGPYSYQVTKSECLDLPSKTYETRYFALSVEQMDHYSEIADEMLFDLDELEPTTIYRFLTTLQLILSGYRITDTEETISKEKFFKDPLDNPRINSLLEILEFGTKTIIYCKYTDEIKDITKILSEKYGKDSVEQFYGEMNLEERNIALESFENRACFLVANKQCAGFGLNLQYCSNVIYYNNDYDYGTRSQSEDRVHRIGQTEKVIYTDICAANTLDESILQCLSRKEDLLFKFRDEVSKRKDKAIINKFIYGSMKEVAVTSVAVKEELKECYNE